MARLRILPVNLDALLVELDDLPQTLALFESLRAEPIAGIEELVPAARTLLIRYRPTRLAKAVLVDALRTRRLDAPIERATPLIEIPVDYRGEDLDEVARSLRLSREEVVRRHCAREYAVAFTGFAPGFAYLSGGDPSLNVPRRASPRIRIPAGAVGLAGPYSGIYPQASPGGWQLIGMTTTPLWDLARDPPALLRPGCRVRFVDVTGDGSAAGVPDLATAATAATAAISVTSATAAISVTSATAATSPTCAAVLPGHAALRVIRGSLQVLFQDEGRRGQAALGLSASGALDKRALRAANRLVGNPADAFGQEAACIEIADGGLVLECIGDAVLAFTGADADITRTSADGPPSSPPRYHAIAVCEGDRIAIGTPRAGSRAYLAARGGFLVSPVLGSRSTDTLARVGPPAITTGDTLPIVPVARGAIVGAPEPAPEDLPARDRIVTLDVVLGPRTDWFTPAALELLASQLWTVTPRSDRVGLRLTGEHPMARAITTELPSEGTVAGALQVPPDGQPVLFLADHPLTGGYPVIGAVAPHHLDRAGQIPVGANLRFNLIEPFAVS